MTSVLRSQKNRASSVQVYSSLCTTITASHFGQHNIGNPVESQFYATETGKYSLSKLGKTYTQKIMDSKEHIYTYICIHRHFWGVIFRCKNNALRFFLEMELRVGSNIMILFVYILLLLIWHMYLYILHCQLS